MPREILDAGPENLPLFPARLKPHCSLTRRNFHVLMVIYIGASIISSLPFVLLCAWPVAGSDRRRSCGTGYCRSLFNICAGCWKAEPAARCFHTSPAVHQFVIQPANRGLKAV